jgi:GTP cyclohydrolase I
MIKNSALTVNDVEIQQLFGHEALVRSGKLEQVMAARSAQMPSEAMTQSVRQLLIELGEDPEREGLRDTPKRMARMLREVTSGYDIDLDSIINGAIFQEEYDQPIVVKDISFFSLCEHHVLPFFGVAHISYIPKGQVVGLSKIPRIVEAFSRRLQVQERLTTEIADFLDENLQPSGVSVILEGTHFCAVMRGVQQPSSKMRTFALRGVFERDPEDAWRVLGY